MQYFLRLRDERSALSRLDDILGSETRNAVAKHELIEIVRTTKDRVAVTDKTLTEGMGNVGMLYPIKIGREVVEQEIFEKAAAKLADFGIELLDVRFKRINYNETVRRRIYERMVSGASKSLPAFVPKERVLRPRLLVRKKETYRKLSPSLTNEYRKFMEKPMPKHLRSMQKPMTAVLPPRSFTSLLRLWKLTARYYPRMYPWF